MFRDDKDCGKVNGTRRGTTRGWGEIAPYSSKASVDFMGNVAFGHHPVGWSRGKQKED